MTKSVDSRDTMDSLQHQGHPILLRKEISILDALIYHVQSIPDNIAYTFLKSDEERCSVTYRELDDRARRIFAALEGARLSESEICDLVEGAKTGATLYL